MTDTTAAEPAAPQPPADRAALRQHLAEAIRAAACPGDCGQTEEECARERIQPFAWHHGRLAIVEGTPEQFADAVLAVLPAPVDQAAVLRDAEAALRAQGKHLAGEFADGDILHEDGPAATVATWKRAADLLRRMADEAQPAEAHPAEHTWAAELYDPVADEWVPGTRYADRDRAMNHLNHARTVGPTWKDGTPTQRRLVRATTTYTVEPPAAEAQQDGTQP